MDLSHYAISDIGLKRKQNEDSVLSEPSLNLFVLSDGMGGHAAGDVASRITVEGVRDFIKDQTGASEEDIDQLNPGFPDGLDLPGKKLICSIMSANALIKEDAAQHPDRDGMGSTVAAVYFYRRVAYVAHVGDSRVYLIRRGIPRLLTEDHSVLNEELRRGRYSREDLEQLEFKDQLARAMGHMEKGKVDLSNARCRKNDIFILCSDGLWDLVEDIEIAEIVEAHKGDLEAAGKALVEKAKEYGGHDNISVILVRVEN